MYDEVWLVAGGEPGAKRFGGLMQRLRKDRKLSVAEVASRAELSVGTVRAVEQGRRAPSAESGIRLLDLLLPSISLPDREGAAKDPGNVGYDYSFIDPTTDARVVVRFQARTAGDNRRWASDLPRPGESRAEAILREMANDPERWAEFQKGFREHVLPALDVLKAVGDEAKAVAGRPATDEQYGRLVRRLVGYNEFRLDRIEKLLIWWDKVDDATADDHVRDVVSRVESALDEITILGPEERAQLAAWDAEEAAAQGEAGE
jgi:transcriptional regulator with XRE-family HTH domain